MHTQTHMHICTSTHTLTYTQPCTHISTHTHTHTYTLTHIDMHTDISTHMYTYTCTHICANIFMHIQYTLMNYLYIIFVETSEALGNKNYISALSTYLYGTNQRICSMNVH